MPVFNYQAYQNDKIVRGVIEGDSPKVARQQLRQQGLLPIEVTFVSKQNTRSAKETMNKTRSVRIRLVELTLFTRQLASLVEAGFPLEEALRAVAEQAERDKLRSLLLAIRNAVLEGQSLSQALGQYPSVFPPIYLAAVNAGESSSHLDMILEELANYLERRSVIRQKLQQALIYPCVVTFVCLAIVTFLLTYVVPKMVHVFSSMHETLPGVTVFLINLSDFIKADGLYVLIGFLVAFALFKRSLKQANMQMRWHRFLLRLPLLGRMIATVNTGRFSQTLGMLLGAGVPLLDAMQIACGLVQNLLINQSLVFAREQVKEGQNLQQSLKKTTYFPPMSIHLIASGEASSRLPEMLDRAAKQQENEMNRLIDIGLTLFEPIMILVMGGVVLFIVLAILLPIFSMDQMIKL